MLIKIIFPSLLLLLTHNVVAEKKPDFVEFIHEQHTWVDSVFNTLSPKEKIAQLFMVRAHTNLGQRYIDSVAGVIEREQLGGIVLFQGGPVRHAQTINRYQSLSKVPLLVALDGEWGLGMRMPDSTVSYPYQMTLGAIQNEALIYQMGKAVAKDFKRLGMNVNFAPVVDINNNPRNPVINFRSFGEDKNNVTSKGMAYMQGMMDEGIIVSLKHFPGHGDTDVDSHYDLPLLPFTAERLDTLELYPFEQLIAAGASGMMVAHMNIPGLDNTPNLPSSLSKPIITDLLKNKLGFKGLIFTDAMDMKGVTKHFKNGEADVRAVIAGNDLIELSENSQRAIDMVLQAIEQNQLTQVEIDQRVKKILAAKYWLHLDRLTPIDTDELYESLNKPSSQRLNQRLAEAAITLLNSDNPIRELNYQEPTAIISIGTNNLSVFQKAIEKRFEEPKHFIISHQATLQEIAKIREELTHFKQIIVSMHDNRTRPRNTLNYNSTTGNFVRELTAMNSIFCVFANPYSIAEWPELQQAPALLMCYQNEENLQRAAAKVITRKLKPSGKLPVTINASFRFGDGL